MAASKIRCLSFVAVLCFTGCNSNEKYKEDLNPENHPTTIIHAAFALGETKDTSAIKPLLKSILDPRMSTNLRFKGMTVCYCKLASLREITGIESPNKLDQFGQDTAAAKFYLNWAIENGIVKSTDSIDLNYYHN
jgi:hypothetical protein